MDAAGSDRNRFRRHLYKFYVNAGRTFFMAFKMLSTLENPAKAIFQEPECLYKEVRVFHEKVGFIAHETTASTDVML